MGNGAFLTHIKAVIQVHSEMEFIVFGFRWSDTGKNAKVILDLEKKKTLVKVSLGEWSYFVLRSHFGISVGLEFPRAELI